MQKLLLNRVLIVINMILIFICGTSFSTDRYVSLSGTNDSANGYTNWLGAATNIQWAVNVAAASETVLVSNGTYWLTNQIAFTNGITVRSVNGRDLTIVNGNYPTCTNRCFWVTNANALVQGFMITNGYVTNSNGGGVYLKNGATVRNCLISGNKVRGTASGQGGGVFIDANGTVDLCSLIGNVVTGSVTGGGGVFLSSGGTVTNCTIAWNTVMITNDSGGGGAGVYFSSGGLVQNCMVLSNVLQDVKDGNGGKGGGVFIYSGGNLINSIINGNTNNGRGGGVIIYPGGGTVQNCLIASNQSQNTGCGVCWYYWGIFQNCTIVGNRGNSGLWHYGGATLGERIENCIIVSNYNSGGGLQSWRLDGVFTNLAISNTCTESTNFTSTSGGGGAGVQSSGCITNYPSFVNYSAGNYRLANNSPCINRGLNQSWMNTAVDLDGHARIRYGIVDMGTYERVNEGTVYRFH